MPDIFNLGLNFELLLVAFALLVVLVVSMVGLAWYYVRAWRNLPLAADDGDLETRIRQKRERIVDLDAGIAEREKNQGERDNLGADVRFLESRRDEIKAEIATLEDGRAQLAQYESELQQLIEQLAFKSEDLEEMRRACKEQEARAEATERRADTAENRIEGFRKVEAALQDELNQLEQQVEEARTLQSALPELRESTDALKADQVRLKAEKTRLRAALAELKDKVSIARELQAELEV